MTNFLKKQKVKKLKKEVSNDPPMDLESLRNVFRKSLKIREDYDNYTEWEIDLAVEKMVWDLIKAMKE